MPLCICACIYLMPLCIYACIYLMPLCIYACIYLMPLCIYARIYLMPLCIYYVVSYSCRPIHVTLFSLHLYFYSNKQHNNITAWFRLSLLVPNNNWLIINVHNNEWWPPEFTTDKSAKLFIQAIKGRGGGSGCLPLSGALAPLL